MRRSGRFAAPTRASGCNRGLRSRKGGGPGQPAGPGRPGRRYARSRPVHTARLLENCPEAKDCLGESRGSIPGSGRTLRLSPRLRRFRHRRRNRGRDCPAGLHPAAECTGRPRARRVAPRADMEIHDTVRARAVQVNAPSAMPSMARITGDAPSIARTSMGRAPPSNGSDPLSHKEAASRG